MGVLCGCADASDRSAVSHIGYDSMRIHTKSTKVGLSCRCRDSHHRFMGEGRETELLKHLPK